MSHETKRETYHETKRETDPGAVEDVSVAALRTLADTAWHELVLAMRAADLAFEAWEHAQAQGLTAQLDGCWMLYLERWSEECDARDRYHAVWAKLRSAIPSYSSYEEAA